MAVLIIVEDVDAGASLRSWLTQQGWSAKLDSTPGTMGAAETVSIVAAGTATARAALGVVREWMRATRRRVAVELKDVGSFEAEGPADIDTLLALLETHAERFESQ